MKDGRTHLNYKVENAVDLETEIIVTAEVYRGDCADTLTIEDTVVAVQTHLNEAETDCEIEEVVADKGYHSEDLLDRLQNESHQRTHFPEPKPKTNRTWKNKPPRREAAKQTALSLFLENPVKKPPPPPSSSWRPRARPEENSRDRLLLD